MPNSYIDYTATAGQTVWSSVTLDYLLTAHLGVAITSAGGTVYTVAAADVTVTESPSLTVTIDSGKYGSGGSVYAVQAGDKVRIARTTPIDNLTRTFNDGSVLKASDLNSQAKQLLFSLQEQEDKGVGSLPVDTDGRYDAGGRIIKNVATPVDGHHVATMQFVDDAMALLDGSLESLTSPQSWALTGSDFTESGDHAYYEFDPAPTSIEAKTFLVEVGGVLQHPGDDYTVTMDATTNIVRLTLLDQDDIADSEKVQVRNFGVSRNQAISPFISSDAAPAMKVQQGGGVTSQNTMEVQSSTSVNQAAFTYDGKFRVGTGVGTAATQTEIRSSAEENAVEVGDYSTGNTAGAEVRQDINGLVNDDYGQVLVSGQSAVTATVKAIEVYKNGSNLFYVNYAGNLVNAGNITATGTITSVAGFVAPAGMNVTGGKLDVQGGAELEVNGTLDVNGASSFGDDITVGNGADLTFGNSTCRLRMNNGSSITLEQNATIDMDSGGSGYLYVPGSIVQIQSHQTDVPNVVTGTADLAETLVTDGVNDFAVQITPKKADSKILVEATVFYEANINNVLGFFRTVSSSPPVTTYLRAPAAGSRHVGIASHYDGSVGATPAVVTVRWMDTPNTTDPVKYHLYFSHAGAGGYYAINRSYADTDNSSHERGVSLITATEIAG